MENELEAKLLSLLGSIASYNDKGYQWMKHDKERVRIEQKKYANKLQELLHKFGVENLTNQAVDVFLSPAVTGDYDGSYEATARKLLETGGFYVQSKA